MKVETNKIPDSNLDQNTVTRNGNTEDIINSVLRMDKKTGDEFCKFSQQFSDGEEGLRLLWNYTRNINYQADKKKQIIKAPAALYKMGVGDCKSKTLFINAVLRCLNIPYIIRFANYKKSQKKIKHVYTVALIDGKEFPIDSVYHLFGVEKPYNIKIDFPMAEIIEITGLDFDKVNKELTVNQEELKIPHSVTNACSLYAGSNVAHLEELRQKKEYVLPPPPIEFHKVSEGTARLQIAERQLRILEVMQPNKAEFCKKGKEMIQKAIKGNYSLTGDIPIELSNLCVLIQQAEGLQMKANSFGLQEQITQAKLQNIQGDHRRCSSIGTTYPDRFCLFTTLYDMQGYQPTDINGANITFNATLDNSYTSQTNTGAQSHWGVCDMTDPAQFMAMNIIAMNGSTMLTDPNKTYGDIMKYYYGRNSEYGAYYNQNGADILSAIQSLNGTLLDDLDRIHPPTRTGIWSALFSSQNNYDATLEILKGESGVMSNFVNDIFRADNTSINGTIGSGLFYHFSSAITSNGSSISPNDLPNVVGTKKAFQDSFLDSCNIFSGVSAVNLSGLTRNGVLYDSGKQPEPTLNYLYSMYKTGNIPSGGVSGHTVGEPITAIIGAIAVAVVAIVGAVAAAVAEGQKAESQAPLIDTSLNDAANFRPLTQSTMTAGNDWLPVGGMGSNPGTTPPGVTPPGTTTSNTPLILGGLALGAFALTRDKKKKKK